MVEDDIDRIHLVSLRNWLAEPLEPGQEDTHEEEAREQETAGENKELPIKPTVRGLTEAL